MSAPPYMKLYVADYLGDTQHLGAIEHGAYLLILMAMWRAGGKLPRDQTKLAKIARCSSAEWSEIGPTVLEFFAVRGGQITHRRVSEEMAKYDRVVEGSKLAGKASAFQRANKNNELGSTSVEKTLNGNPTNLEPESELERKNKAKPSESESLPRQARERAINPERMAGMIFDALPHVSRMKTGGDPFRIRQAIEHRLAEGDDPRHVFNSAMTYAKHPFHQKDGGARSDQIHKLIHVGFLIAWAQSGHTLSIPETFGGQPLRWTRPEGAIRPPVMLPALSTVMVDGYSHEVPEWEGAVSSALAEARIRHHLEIVDEWDGYKRDPGLWQSSWGPKPWEPRCKIWPSVLALRGVSIEDPRHSVRKQA